MITNETNEVRKIAKQIEEVAIRATVQQCGTKSGRPMYIYKLGPFISSPFDSLAACKCQATKHEKRGLSSEFLRRFAAKTH